MSVYCVCGGKSIMFDHFDSRDPSRLLCIIAMTMTLFIPWPFHHHRPIDQHTTASGLSTWWFGAREGKCHCSALGLVDGTRATTHRAWRGWPWRERWGQMVDGGCTGEENIGKHGYLFEKNVPHIGTWWTWDIWNFGLEKPGAGLLQNAWTNVCGIGWLIGQQESTVQLLDLEISGLDGHV